MPRTKTVKRKTPTKPRYTKVAKPIIVDDSPETLTDFFTIAIMNYNAKTKGIGVSTVDTAEGAETPYKVGVMCDDSLQFFYGFYNKEYRNRPTFKTIDGIWVLGKGWKMYDEGVKEKS